MKRAGAGNNVDLGAIAYAYQGRLARVALGLRLKLSRSAEASPAPPTASLEMA